MAKNEATLLVRIKQAGGDVLDKIGVSLKGLGSAAAAVGTGLAAFGAAAVASFRESEKATNELNQAMINQGVYTTELSQKYSEMASKLEGLTQFADEQVTSAQATLQTFIGQREVTEELTKATLDLAAAKKIDLASAAQLIGKSIGGETNALSRYGVEIDKTADKTTQMAQAIQGLNSKFGGQAEAAAKGLGTLEQLKNAVDNVLEKVGERLAPFIAFFTKQLTAFATELQSNTSFVNSLDASILGLSKVFLTLKSVAMGAIATISGELGILGEVVTQVMSGNFAQAKDAWATGHAELGEMVKERTSQLALELDELDNAKAATDEAKRQNELMMIQQSEDRKREIKIQSNQSMFTAEQQHAAKLLGIELKKKEDLKKLDEAKVAAQKDTLTTIASLQNSSNKTLAAVGKAAALTQIAIDTPMAISKALAAFPPPFNFAAAGAVGVAMAAQAARVSGIQLAEGGIVRAQPGGVQATIGEGGQDEAVIPLDRAGEFGLGGGGGHTIIFNGPVMGDESQAMEFARAIDKSLLKLRQSNQSVAFETDIF